MSGHWLHSFSSSVDGVGSWLSLAKVFPTETEFQRHKRLARTEHEEHQKELALKTQAAAAIQSKGKKKYCCKDCCGDDKQKDDDCESSECDGPRTVYQRERSHMLSEWITIVMFALVWIFFFFWLMRRCSSRLHQIWYAAQQQQQQQQ